MSAATQMTIGNRVNRAMFLVCCNLLMFIMPLSAQLPFAVEQVTIANKYKNAFTTPAYQKEAFALLLQEANAVAKDLHLPEPLPIDPSNGVSGFVSPFGFAFNSKSLGSIDTSNYHYYVAAGCKFNHVAIANYDDVCRSFCEQFVWPIDRVDTNNAYLLARQWLEDAKMDVKALNRDCQLHVMIDPFWNDVRHGAVGKNRTFVPMYVVSWMTREKLSDDEAAFGIKADVQLCAPTKTLISLLVMDPKYILRKPLIFTNLEELIGAGNVPWKLTNILETTNFP